jgi:hypothetical protein
MSLTSSPAWIFQWTLYVIPGRPCPDGIHTNTLDTPSLIKSEKPANYIHQQSSYPEGNHLTMHVLGTIGRSFSQQRKTSKPKDLQIRKVSFSGSSLSSSCSLSSFSITYTARAPLSARTTTSFDPLNSYATFQPPLRLHERPLISPERPRHQPASTFFDDSTDEEFDDQKSIDVNYAVGKAEEMILPPHASSMDHSSLPQDYFTLQMAKRPPMTLYSRWSESTIQTLDLGDLSAADDDYDQATPDTNADVPLDIPNFSHKRNVTSKRPPMRSLDSLDDLIKKSGWKRRGIVFNGEEAEHDA